MKFCIRETFDFLLLLIYSFLYYVLTILLAIRFYTIVQNRFFLFFCNMIKPVEMILFSLRPIEYSFLRTCNFMWCHHDRVIHVDPVCLYISVFIIFVTRIVVYSLSTELDLYDALTMSSIQLCLTGLIKSVNYLFTS